MKAIEGSNELVLTNEKHYIYIHEVVVNKGDEQTTQQIVTM